MHLKPAVLLCLLAGVFGSGDPESVWVMLGDPLTLHTGIGSVQRDHHVEWRFGPDSPDGQIAELVRWSYMLSVFVSGRMPFRDALQLDHQTGALTIQNTTPDHAGLYKLTIVHNKKTSRKKFDVKVYAPLPVPVIRADSSQSSHRSSSPVCVLLCSVTNASRVTLSFFRGGDLVSSISGSDSSSSLSLPLDVEHLDGNTYSCVVNNSISHRSTLFNISDLCRTPPDASDVSLLYCLLLLLLIPVSVTVVLLCVCRRHEKQERDGEHHTAVSRFCSQVWSYDEAYINV